MLTLLATAAIGQAAIIPRPVVLVPKLGTFHLALDTGIAAAPAASEDAETLRAMLRPATGYPLDITRRTGSNRINLILDTRLKRLGPEGYTLDVRSDRIELRALGHDGLFYGMQTLRQLLPAAILRRAAMPGQDWSIPCLAIEDFPRFGWRGAMIDSCRHFLPKEAILRFLDTLALHKFNHFHWHLTDDNGWRIEIKRYPKLTEVGAWVPESLPDYDPPKNPMHNHGGFYTQDDIREVVAYAAARHITVVPEIEMPGHAGALIASYPELGTPGSNVLNAEDGTIHFMQNVLDEVMGLFPSQFIHVGGDEVDKGPWHRDPATQARLKSLGLKSEDEVQSWIIHQMDAYLTLKGRRLIGWDEILEGGLAPGATVMSWRGIDGGIAAAKAGHDVVMAPTSHTYLDYLQGDPATEPKGIGGFVPLDRVYSFEPIPKDLSASESKHVLGAQGQLWSEYIPNSRHLEYMAWPRLCALSEVVWSPKEGKSFEDFVGRLPADLDRLRAMDVNFRPLVGQPKDVIGGWKTGEVMEAVSQREFDVSPKVSAAGTYEVVFSYLEGACRLDIQSVVLLEDGAVIAGDTHSGSTGGTNQDNVYRLTVSAVHTGKRYTLRAFVRTDGGTDSTGSIRFSRLP